MERTTVVIVGAGPAGLVLGHVLARAGIGFVVLERRDRADVGGPPKAGSIDFRTVELLRAEGIADVDVTFDVENGTCEFRTPTESVVLDYGALTGGRPHYIHPQHLLVERLCATLLDRGGDVRFDRRVTGVTGVADAADDAGGAWVSFVDGRGQRGERGELRADVVVGCDGARSTVAPTLTDVRVTEVELPVRLLGMIAPAPPLVPHTLYGAHPRGYAGQMRRGPEQTRYYLEVPGADAIEDWPEDRCRAEVEERLGVHGRLAGVPLTDRTLFDLRVRVTEPMQQGRLFLAGDAAHLITPAGGKGMNLGIRDAVELAHGLIDRFGPRGDGARLDAYSATRLREIWRVEAFSAWFLNIMLANGAGGLAGGPFARGVRDGWVASLVQDPLLARWFAHAYAGADPA